ncbi:CRISPR system Cascade subunit CasB [Ruminococcus sp. YE71]|nr:type I-E CRISPR-associated protein Cse2/CasB [Ruminococcus sp. YE78]SDA32280.1 CRISPR system Cascade subunit CasB [Ruminococcus sp. YE78]SFW53134.1 CRISPR system Cascade subunit CasB [Ruminococcus sp. YE71]
MIRADEVYKYTLRKIKYLQSVKDSGAGKGLLAELRRGVGKHPGEMPELWGFIFVGMPDELFEKKNSYRFEFAVYTALTLYALHCQGSDREVYAEGVSIGQAAAALVSSDDDIPRVMNRLNLVVTAVSPDDLAYYLRGLIQLIKGCNTGLDHAKLAKEIYSFSNNNAANSIKLSWGRDFYRSIYYNTKGENKNG